MRKRYGIFGGTFDPVHVGHLISAQYILTEFSLDRIIFIPAYIPPHKAGKKRLSSNHRLIMVKKAIKGNKHFTVSNFEIEKRTRSYTIHTLEHYLKESRLFLIIGDEWLNRFSDWHRWRDILGYSDLIVLRRQGLEVKIPAFLNTFKRKIHFSSNPLIQISSSLIRQYLKQKKDIRYMVPSSVWQYIQKKELYG